MRRLGKNYIDRRHRHLLGGTLHSARIAIAAHEMILALSLFGISYEMESVATGCPMTYAAPKYRWGRLKLGWASYYCYHYHHGHRAAKSNNQKDNDRDKAKQLRYDAKENPSGE